MQRKKICIVGAGVVGLSVAVRSIQEFGEGQIDITIIAETFYNQTCSFGAGGLWEPYAIDGTPDSKINEWGRYAFKHFNALLHSPYAAQSGVQLLTAYNLLEAHQDATPPSWSDIVYNFKMLTADEIRDMGLPSKYVNGFTFGTLVIEQKYYLKFLMDNLKNSGVKFIQKRLNNISEVFGQGYDAVINCTGMGAFQANNDKEMYPVRGQVLRVRAPWINNVWFFGKSYIIPNVDNVVIGGTTQKGNWNTNVDNADTERIVNDIAAVFPSIRDAQVENIWVGLRPGRAPLRLESETRNGQFVVHNYGHGGSGVTVAMGCAQDVVINHLKPHLFGNQGRGKCCGQSCSQDTMQSASDLSSWIKHRSRL